MRPTKPKSWVFYAKKMVRLQLQALWCGHIHLLVGAQPPKQTMHHKHTATLQIKKICQTQVAQLQTKHLHQIQTWTLPKLAMTARFCRQTIHDKKRVKKNLQKKQRAFADKTCTINTCNYKRNFISKKKKQAK